MKMTSNTGLEYLNPTQKKKLKNSLDEKYKIVPFIATTDDVAIQQNAKDTSIQNYMGSIEYRYEELAIAIVLMACRDYIEGRKNCLAKKRMESAREFLLSERLSLYTDVDGKKIVEKLNTLDNWHQFELSFVRGGYCND